MREKTLGEDLAVRYYTSVRRDGLGEILPTEFLGIVSFNPVVFTDERTE